MGCHNSSIELNPKIYKPAVEILDSQSSDEYISNSISLLIEQLKSYELIRDWAKISSFSYCQIPISDHGSITELCISMLLSNYEQDREEIFIAARKLVPYLITLTETGTDSQKKLSLELMNYYLKDAKDHELSHLIKANSCKSILISLSSEDLALSISAAQFLQQMCIRSRLSKKHFTEQGGLSILSNQFQKFKDMGSDKTQALRNLEKLFHP